MTPLEIKRTLARLGMAPNKRSGQHFLVDGRIIDRQIDYAGVCESDAVLEIGPGLGALTKKLLEKAGRVVAIERDRRLCDFLETGLESALESDKLELVRGDALKVELPEFDKVVSNLPYQISSEITFRLLGHEFESGIIMYQKEFAGRMAASPGTKDYSRLSVNVYYRATCEILETVPQNAFYPQPDVDSAIVRLVPRKKPPFSVRDEGLFFELVGALFAHRRKKIGTSLKLWAKERALEDSRLMGLPHLGKRVEDLTPEEIGKLSDEIAARLDQK